jgi:uncharacterized membrane protein YeaQ/YmgE (transglycosylase-associated protein family)
LSGFSQINRINRHVPPAVGGAFDAPTLAADESSVTDKAKEAVKETKQAVVDAGRAAANSFENLWQRVDDSRLKNRTRDEIVAWVIMGALVGAVAGMMTSLKTSGAGKAGRFLLGLGGALIGGVVVHAARINFGWGPVLIRYEELLFSFLGAILLIVIGRLFRSKAKKRPAEK